MSYAGHKFRGQEIAVRSPETAAEVLEYLHKIAPTSLFDVPLYVFGAVRWANRYCVDFDFTMDVLGSGKTAVDDLASLCNAILSAAKIPTKTAAGLNDFYSRFYIEPDNDRTRKETGPVFEDLTHEVINIASVTNTVKEYGPQVLQAPFWVFEALSISYTHDRKRERSAQQRASDIEETRRINAEVFG